jgi:hypothetical protein
MLQEHLTMLLLQSSAVHAQSRMLTLAPIPPLALRHPKMPVLQSLVSLTAEAKKLSGQYVHLMLFNMSDTFWQSSNMLSPHALTTGCEMYLPRLQYPKICKSENVWPTPK